jgi:hypothetical protein
VSRIDARVVGCAILAGAVSLIAPVVLGGGILALGIVSAILTGRSVVRSNEGDVTTAVVAGGVLTAFALGQGHLAAIACGAGVFAGSEISALGRRFDVGRDAPTAPEVAITAMTIGVGGVVGAAIAVVASVRASPGVANAALVAVVVLGVVLLAARRRHDE